MRYRGHGICPYCARPMLGTDKLSRIGFTSGQMKIVRFLERHVGSSRFSISELSTVTGIPHETVSVYTSQIRRKLIEAGSHYRIKRTREARTNQYELIRVGSENVNKDSAAKHKEALPS